MELEEQAGSVILRVGAATGGDDFRAIHAEYVAFYFTKKFDETLRWAVHFYARRTGHELVRRRDLIPGDPRPSTRRRLRQVRI